MKRMLTIACMGLMLLLPEASKAQFNPYSEGTPMVSAGIGLSSWGIPIYGRVVFPVADNITVGGGLAYRNYGYSAFWNVSIFSISARGNYHFNELIDLDDQWDVYGGLDVTYDITSYSYEGSSGSSTWRGGGPAGVGVSIHAGGRYFIKPKLGLNAELNGGTISGVLFGVTFLL